jgi:hypothetical protein
MAADQGEDGTYTTTATSCSGHRSLYSKYAHALPNRAEPTDAFHSPLRVNITYRELGNYGYECWVGNMH